MVEARQIDAWNHTSSVIATIIKVNAGKKANNLDLSKIHPYAKKIKRRTQKRLSKEESYKRLHAMVGIHGRDTHYATDSAWEVEQHGVSADTDGG